MVYDFYKNGNQIKTLKLFLGSFFGGKGNKIGISCDYSFGNNNSFNEIISSKFEDGKLYMETMTIEGAVKEIWMNFIQPFL